jgi:hypothetical protein
MGMEDTPHRKYEWVLLLAWNENTICFQDSVNGTMCREQTS